MHLAVVKNNSRWVRFFDAHAPVYEHNVFTRNTVAEVDFLTGVLDLSPTARVLDVGCGTGRHAVELACRGYAVTGLDISSGMLHEARRAATAAGVNVDWVQADATAFTFSRCFDAVICLCEGAFGLLEAGDDAVEQPLSILRNIAAVLKPGAKCLFTVLNGMAMVRRHTPSDIAQGVFDPLTLTEVSDCCPADNTGATTLRERGFMPTELALLFSLAGLEIQSVWGGTAGQWGKRMIDPDEMEIMVLARNTRIAQDP